MTSSPRPSAEAEERCPTVILTEDFEAITQRVRAILVSRGATLDAAEEYAQQAIVETYVRAATIRDPGATRKFVLTIADRLRLDATRSWPWEPMADLGDQQVVLVHGDDPAAAVTRAETLAELDTALGNLPARERDVVVALNGHGEDTVSIGHRHGLTRRSVIELAYRTRRRLRAMLQAA